MKKKLFFTSRLVIKDLILMLQLDPNGSVDNINSHCLSLLVTKLNNCVSQLEQFPVKVHDLPAGAGGARGGTSALKFFNTHQLKVRLYFLNLK